MVRSLAPVADNVHATDHLANSEETNDLSSSDTGEGQLLGAGVTDAGQEALGRREVEALDGGRVAGDVDQGLEVGLEGGQSTGYPVLDTGVGMGVLMRLGQLTEETCSGHGTPACRAQDRPWSSRSSGESWLW